jgi:hypothetical protein
MDLKMICWLVAADTYTDTHPDNKLDASQLSFNS